MILDRPSKIFTYYGQDALCKFIVCYENSLEALEKFLVDINGVYREITIGYQKTYLSFKVF